MPTSLLFYLLTLVHLLEINTDGSAGAASANYPDGPSTLQWPGTATLSPVDGRVYFVMRESFGFKPPWRSISPALSTWVDGPTVTTAFLSGSGSESAIGIAVTAAGEILTLCRTGSTGYSIVRFPSADSGAWNHQWALPDMLTSDYPDAGALITVNHVAYALYNSKRLDRLNLITGVVDAFFTVGGTETLHAPAYDGERVRLMSRDASHVIRLYTINPDDPSDYTVESLGALFGMAGTSFGPGTGTVLGRTYYFGPGGANWVYAYDLDAHTATQFTAQGDKNWVVPTFTDQVYPVTTETLDTNTAMIARVTTDAQLLVTPAGMIEE